jgi:hypothetical protein
MHLLSKGVKPVLWTCLYHGIFRLAANSPVAFAPICEQLTQHRSPTCYCVTHIYCPPKGDRPFYF